MVDFESNSTIMRNKKEIEEITILQRRYNVINALKDYKVRVFKDRNPELSIPDLRSELIALYYEVDSIIEKDLKKDKTYLDNTEVLNKIEEGTEQELIKVWEYLNKLLYRQHLTQVDSNKQINWEDPEEVNEENDL